MTSDSEHVSLCGCGVYNSPRSTECWSCGRRLLSGDGKSPVDAPGELPEGFAASPSVQSPVQSCADDFEATSEERTKHAAADTPANGDLQDVEDDQFSLRGLVILSGCMAVSLPMAAASPVTAGIGILIAIVASAPLIRWCRAAKRDRERLTPIIPLNKIDDASSLTRSAPNRFVLWVGEVMASIALVFILFASSFGAFCLVCFPLSLGASGGPRAPVDSWLLKSAIGPFGGTRFAEMAGLSVAALASAFAYRLAVNEVVWSCDAPKVRSSMKSRLAGVGVRMASVAVLCLVAFGTVLAVVAAFVTIAQDESYLKGSEIHGGLGRTGFLVAFFMALITTNLAISRLVRWTRRRLRRSVGGA